MSGIRESTGVADFENADSSINESATHKHPMICAFDLPEIFELELKRLKFNYELGSFGSCVKVNNKNHEKKYLRLNHDYPKNLHEFDIVIADLTCTKSIEYDPSLPFLKEAAGSKSYALQSSYPQQVFDPRQFSIKIISNEINEILKKKSILIVFFGTYISTEYQFVEISAGGTSLGSRETYLNHYIYGGFPGSKNKNGRKVHTAGDANFLTPLLNKHIENIEYHCVFEHKTNYYLGKHQKDPTIIPLLFNEREEVVSYLHFVKDSVVLALPDIDDKTEFLSDLLSIYLPEKFPQLFPSHGEFGWLSNGDYLLPGENQLLQDRMNIEQKYLQDIADNENKLADLKYEFSFLTDLISETGNRLVASVEHFLRWLGFESVVNFDDSNPETLEEDIQVDCGDRFLVIEVKGIGGTSTDKDCSQISKIRYRRIRQRGKVDVYGLYIVNHQRYMPPKSRTNPPFTINQIEDAVNDDRGLLTTYELYKAYFLIEDGVLEKSDVLESFFCKGLIELKPKGIVSIGVPAELFSDGHIAIVNLVDTSLCVGDHLIVKKQDEYSKVSILSLRVNDQDVDSCSSGEVGIRLDRKLKRNSELFVREI